ncbi:unnamed protein product [Withania somnifera]
MENIVHGDQQLAGLTAGLLECYSSKVLPWFLCNGGADEVSLNLAVNIFVKMESSTSLSLGAKRKLVTGCSVESQEKVLQKAINVMETNSFFLSKDLILGTDLFNNKTQLGPTSEGPGSSVNKLPLNISEDCSLEEVIDTLFKNVMWRNINIGKEGNDGGAVDMVT